MIEVVVIQDDLKKTYSLHKNLLCERSLYFKKCLETGMLEANHNKIVLQDVNFEAFEIVIYWLYKGNLDKVSDKDLPSYWAYNLADRLCMEPLKNKLVDRLVLIWRNHNITSAEFRTAMEDLHVESKLAAFLIDRLAYDYANGQTNGFEELHDLEHDTLIAVMDAWAVASKAKANLRSEEWDTMDPAKNVICIYHEHIDTLKCRHSADTERSTRFTPGKYRPPECHTLACGKMPAISARAWDLFRMIEDQEEMQDGAGVNMQEIVDNMKITQHEVHIRASELVFNEYIFASEHSNTGLSSWTSQRAEASPWLDVSYSSQLD
jgi:hypothetical protein